MAMKLNLAYPQNGSQKLIELDDEKKTRLFYDRRLAEEVPADALGDEFKGYIIKITGGHDKQGFAMKQGVLLNHRTRLLLDGTTSGFHPWKRPGHRKRKSVRGAIIGPDISVINAIIVKKGAADLPGLTDPDSVKPSLRGPKRANNIRKLWGLSKEEDVRQFVSRKKIKDGKNGKPRFKSPKIQRLITPVMLHRKKHRLAVKKRRYEKSKKEAADYAALLANIRREKRKALIEKRRAISERKSERKSERLSQKAEKEGKTKTPAKATGKGKDDKAAKPDAKGAKGAAKKDETKGKAPATKQTSKGELPKGKDAGKGKEQPAKGAKAPATKQTSKTDIPKGKDAGKGKEQPAAKGDAKGKTPAGKQTSKTDVKGTPASKQPSKSDAAKGADKQPAKADAGKTPAKQTKSEGAAAKPAADKPAAKPAAKPAGDKPAAKPAGDKPAAKPAGEKPAAKPAAEKPAAKPAESAPKPAAEKPAAKPAPAQKPAQPKQGTGDKRPPEGGDKGQQNKKPKK